MVSLRSWLDFLSAVIHIYTSASSSDEPAIINNNTGNNDGNTKTSNNNILYTYYSYISIFKEIITILHEHSKGLYNETQCSWFISEIILIIFLAVSSTIIIVKLPCCNWTLSRRFSLSLLTVKDVRCKVNVREDVMEFSQTHSSSKRSNHNRNVHWNLTNIPITEKNTKYPKY